MKNTYRVDGINVTDTIQVIYDLCMTKGVVLDLKKKGLMPLKGRYTKFTGT